MSLSLRSGILAAVAGACLAVASPASAATQFGDSCVGGGGAPGDFTLTTLSAPPAALPLTAPTAGVITQVRVNSAIELSSYPVSVKLLRSAGGNNYTVVGEQSLSVNPGITVASARIPVQSGDRLGVYGEAITIAGVEQHVSPFCVGAEGGLGAFVGNAKAGSTAEFFEPAPGRVPLSAIIESDADGDGYGDETQDKCPQSVSTQAECGPVILNSYAVPGKGQAVILVATNTAGAITVSGSASLPKVAKHPKQASASVKARAAALKGVTQAVSPGAIGRFVLKFPGSLKRALTTLPKGKKLRVKITASEANAAGVLSETVAVLNLKG